MDADELEAQLEANLYSGGSPVEVPATVEPAPEAPAAEAPATEQPAAEAPETPAAEQPAEEQPTAEVEQPAAEVPPVDETETVADRFRFKSQTPAERAKIAAAKQIADNEGIPFSDAYVRVLGLNAKQEEPAAEAEPEPAPDPLQARLAEVQAALDAAAEEGSLYGPELRKLQREEAELLADIKIAKVQAEEQARYEAELQQQEAKSAADAIWDEDVSEIQQLYGDAALDTGPLGKAISDELDKIEKSPNHRFHEAFQKGKLLPMDIAPYLAARLGIAPVSKSSAAPAQPATPVAKAQPATLPVSGGHRTTPTVPINPAQKQAALQSSLAQASVDPDAAAELLDAALSGGQAPVSRIRLA